MTVGWCFEGIVGFIRRFERSQIASQPSRSSVCYCCLIDLCSLTSRVLNDQLGTVGSARSSQTHEMEPDSARMPLVVKCAPKSV
jgi:hypothetical protein